MKLKLVYELWDRARYINMRYTVHILILSNAGQFFALVSFNLLLFLFFVTTECIKERDCIQSAPIIGPR